MTDPDHRASLAKLGLRRAKDFSWERTAKRTHDVYMQTLRAPTRSEQRRTERQHDSEQRRAAKKPKENADADPGTPPAAVALLESDD